MFLAHCIICPNNLFYKQNSSFFMIFLDQSCFGQMIQTMFIILLQIVNNRNSAMKRKEHRKIRPTLTLEDFNNLSVLTDSGSEKSQESGPSYPF